MNTTIETLSADGRLPRRTWAASIWVRTSRAGTVAAAILFALQGACASVDQPTVATRSASVKPGINDAYKADDLDVEKWVARFEVESREVYEQREGLLAAAGIRRGETVADIGAGTGLFTLPFAEAVGRAGRVYAVDITPKFLEHIADRVRAAGVDNVRTVRCEEDSVELPDNSIDVAFICDVYHHFEYPRETMTSLLRAMKPGGRVIIIDFKRIEGVSRDWIMGHVRAGRRTVIDEILSYGFQIVSEDISVEGLSENYVMKFRKPD